MIIPISGYMTESGKFRNFIVAPEGGLRGRVSLSKISDLLVDYVYDLRCYVSVFFCGFTVKLICQGIYIPVLKT